jgi:hypothetical protein
MWEKKGYRRGGAHPAWVLGVASAEAGKGLQYLRRGNVCLGKVVLEGTPQCVLSTER